MDIYKYVNQLAKFGRKHMKTIYPDDHVYFEVEQFKMDWLDDGKPLISVSGRMGRELGPQYKDAVDQREFTHDIDITMKPELTAYAIIFYHYFHE